MFIPTIPRGTDAGLVLMLGLGLGPGLGLGLGLRLGLGLGLRLGFLCWCDELKTISPFDSCVEWMH